MHDSSCSSECCQGSGEPGHSPRLLLSQALCPGTTWLGHLGTLRLPQTRLAISNCSPRPARRSLCSLCAHHTPGHGRFCPQVTEEVHSVTHALVMPLTPVCLALIRSNRCIHKVAKFSVCAFHWYWQEPERIEALQASRHNSVLPCSCHLQPCWLLQCFSLRGFIFALCTHW